MLFTADEFFDFGTDGENGAAAELNISKTAFILQIGDYTVSVTLKNEVSTETFTQNVRTFF